MSVTIIVDYVRLDGSRGSMSCDPESSAKSVAYYEGLGFKVSTERVELCDTCGGTSRIRTANRKHNHSFCADRCWKACPDCK